MIIKKLKRENGQAEIIGIILLISITFIALGIIQSVYVPQWNKNIEYDHYQDVTDDIVGLKSSILRASSLGEVTTGRIKLGTDYPDRYLFINPASASGELKTYDLSFNVSNATALNDELDDYWDGSQISYTTKGMQYKPHYNYQSGVQPYLIEHTGLIRLYQQTPAMMQQSLFQGETIQPIILKGNVSENGHVLEVLDIYPESAPPNTIMMSGDININFTTIAPKAWTNHLDPTNNSYIDEVSYSDINRETIGYSLHQVSVNLNESYNFSLKLSSLSFDRVSGTSKEQKELILTTNQKNHTAPTTLKARVLDRYGNPVSGVRVVFNSTSLKLNEKPIGNNVTVSTDENGYAGVRATNTTKPKNTVLAKIKGRNEDWNKVNYSVLSEAYGGQGGQDNVGPIVKNPDTSNDTVKVGDSFNLTAIIDDRGRGGSDIIEAIWWSNRATPDGSKENGYPMNSSDGEFDQPLEEVQNLTIDTTGWSGGEHNLSIRGRDGNLNWGPINTTTITISALEYRSSLAWNDDGNGEQSVVNFTIENTGGRDRTITAISIDNVSGSFTGKDPDVIRDYDQGGLEVISDGTKNFDGSISIDGTKYSFSNTTTILGGSQVTFTLDEFIREKNNPRERNMSGKGITLTLYMSDGTSKQFDFTVGQPK